MPTNLASLESTLADRRARYGEFAGLSAVAQGLKEVMHGESGWHRLNTMQMEALDMLQHKVARIINGDPNFHDSWRDAIGYLTLVANTLEPEAE